MITVSILKRIALVETISWTLLIVAIVLDRAADWHAGISIMGPIHGVLFLALAAVAVGVTVNQKWPISRLVKMFFSSFVPIYGYFLIDHEAETAP